MHREDRARGGHAQHVCLFESGERWWDNGVKSVTHLCVEESGV